MKVICNRGALSDALMLTSNVVAARTPKPILQCVKLTAEDNTLTIAATDLEVAIRYRDEQVQLESSGQAVIPADKLRDIVRESVDDTLSIESTGDTADIRGQDSHFKIFTQSPAEFPPVPDFSGQPDVEVPAGTRWFRGRVAPIAGSEGSSRRFCLLVRDITAQKEAEQEISRLLSRERLLSRLPEALPVGLFEIDMAGHVTFTNDRMYTIAGQVPAATMEGLMPSVVAEDRPVLESALGAVLADQPVDDLYLGLRPAVADTPLTSGTKRVCALSLRAH